MSRLLTVLIIIIIVIIVYSIPVHKEPSLKISIPEARSRRFGLIIDVRTPKERDQLGYYPNSVPISMEKISNQVPLDIPSKNTWILVYSGDNRATIAAEVLYRMGYRNVKYIKESYLKLMPGE